MKRTVFFAAIVCVGLNSGCMTRGYSWADYKRLPNLDRMIVKPYGAAETLELTEPFHFDGKNVLHGGPFTIDLQPGRAAFMGETNDWKYYRLEQPARFKYARESEPVEQTEVAFILVTDGSVRFAWRPPEDRSIWIAAKLENPPRLVGPTSAAP